MVKVSEEHYPEGKCKDQKWLSNMKVYIEILDENVRVLCLKTLNNKAASFF